MSKTVDEIRERYEELAWARDELAAVGRGGQDSYWLTSEECAEIIAAIEDIPFLLAEVERQRREIEGLERALKYRSPIPTTEEIEAAINDNFGS